MLLLLGNKLGLALTTPFFPLKSPKTIKNVKRLKPKAKNCIFHGGKNKTSDPWRSV